MNYGAIEINALTLKGIPVFKGTDVPVQAFFEYLEDGKSVERFLNDYPSVNLKDAVEVLQMAKVALTNQHILEANFSNK